MQFTVVNNHTQKNVIETCYETIKKKYYFSRDCLNAQFCSLPKLPFSGVVKTSGRRTYSLYWTAIKDLIFKCIFLSTRLLKL